MNTYISMLRGINVSGQKKIRMDDLKRLYGSLGFQSVRTYIQSGNVIFESADINTKDLIHKIEEKIQQVFDYPVTVLLRTPDELEEIVENNPFIEETKKEANKFYVTFLSDVPGRLPLDDIEKAKAASDKIFIAGKEIYFYCPSGYGKTRLSNNFLERKLKVTGTTRNWKTVNQLLDIARQKVS